VRILDATFLVDYLNGHPDTEAYYEANGGPEQRWVIPAPVYAEVLVGVGNLPSGDVDGAVEALSWGAVHPVDEDLSAEAARIAGEVGPQGPYLDGVDALVAAVGRRLDTPVVSADSDLTHEATKRVVDVDEYP